MNDLYSNSTAVSQSTNFSNSTKVRMKSYSDEMGRVQKYRDKQQEIARRWRNFFTDLVGTQVEVCPAFILSISSALSLIRGDVMVSGEDGRGTEGGIGG